MPLGFTRAVTCKLTPVARDWMLLANTELPPDWIGETEVALKVGTSRPTLIEAARLSVAMTLGEDSTLALVAFSCSDSSPSNWRLWPTSMPAVSKAPEPPTVPMRSRVRPLVVTPLPCNAALTPLANAPVRLTS